MTRLILGSTALKKISNHKVNLREQGNTHFECVHCTLYSRQSLVLGSHALQRIQSMRDFFLEPTVYYTPIRGSSSQPQRSVRQGRLLTGLKVFSVQTRMFKTEKKRADHHCRCFKKCLNFHYDASYFESRGYLIC